MAVEGDISESEAGYLAVPDQPGPGVLVVHDWYGLLPPVRAACDELAAAGFCALAPDLYGGRSTTDPAEAEALMEGLDRAGARQVLDDAVDALRLHPAVNPRPVGAVGWSMGGFLTLLTATTGTLDAVVVYYAALEPPAAAPIACPVLVHIAEVDEFDPPDVTEGFVAGLRAGGTTAESVLYPGTEHSFANSAAAAFSAAASAAAWDRTLEFLDRHLRG